MSKPSIDLSKLYKPHPEERLCMEIPNWTIKDFKIKQTTTGYSVYYTHKELKEKSNAAS